MTERSRLRLATDAPAPAGGGAALGARTDEELMALAAADHREAFAELVARHADRVVGYCAKVTADRQAGRELAQETFLQVWAHRRTYAPARPFAVFLFTVACNRCRNHGRWWRRRGQREVGPDEAPEGAAAATGLDDLLARERRRRVHAAIAQLPAKQREAVVLRFDQGLDYADLARVLRSSESTVRARVFQGVRRLRALLHEEEP